MRAKSMVNSFAEYLRNNLSSLEEQGLISFETELSHINTYLDIEKVRFEDTLEIEYDIKCVDFLNRGCRFWKSLLLMAKTN